jgi:multicomponent Na+:H+ antiporter subunit E
VIRAVGLRVAWLTAVWVALWGDVSWGAFLGGALVALALQLVVRFTVEDPLIRRVRPLALLRFVATFSAELLVASVEVARLVLTPRRRVAEAIVAVPLRTRSERLTVLLANCVTLTPGTITIDCIGMPAVLYIHVLNLEDVEEVRRSVHRLEALAARAVGEPVPEVTAS